MKKLPDEIRIRKPKPDLVKELEKFGGGVDSLAAAAHKVLRKHFKLTK